MWLRYLATASDVGSSCVLNAATSWPIKWVPGLLGWEAEVADVKLVCHSCTYGYKNCCALLMLGQWAVTLRCVFDLDIIKLSLATVWTGR